jgi:hypothetical protein
MRKFLNALSFTAVVALLALAFSTSSCSKDDDNDSKDSTSTGSKTGVTKYKKYDIEKGIFVIKSWSTLSPENIEYDTIYFKEYGAYEANYQTDGDSRKLSLVNGDGYFYSIDLVKKTGTKSTSSIARGTEGSNKYEDLVSYSASKLTKYADTTICGKACTYYKYVLSESMYSKTAIYKGIQLYYVASTSNTMGFAFDAIRDCISLQENVSVPDSKFVVPAGATITLFN